eukprot:m.264989 g.264989  ORF g.264989 m.264989 type:complete len:193 (+) comp28951_c0_seq1:82-660(+)
MPGMRSACRGIVAQLAYLSDAIRSPNWFSRLAQTPRRSCYFSPLTMWKTTALIIDATALGASLFAAVDVCTLVSLIENGHSLDIVLPFGRLWWPNSAKLMGPLVTAAIAGNALAFRASMQVNWLVSMASSVLALLLTQCAHSKTPDELLAVGPKTQQSVAAFRALHAVRAATIGVGVVSAGMAFFPRYSIRW